MPIVKNLTNKNIIVFNKILEPGKSISLTQEQLDEIPHLIESGQLKVEVTSVKRTEIATPVLDEISEKQYLEVREKLIQAFFALHFNQSLNKEQLDDLKWFFKNVGPTSQLDNEVLSLLDDIHSEEELLEILLNHLYPELIRDHFKK